MPSAVYGLSAYYLIAPAEASSNLARYDGVRYGLRVDGDDVATMNARTRAAGFGAEVKRRIMLGTYALSAGYYDAYYGKAQRVRTLIIRDFARVYEQCDVVDLPRRRRRWRSSSAPGRKTRSRCTCRTCARSRPTSPVTPAMSVPFGTGARRPARRGAGARARPRRAGDVPGRQGPRGRRPVSVAGQRSVELRTGSTRRASRSAQNQRSAALSTSAASHCRKWPQPGRTNGPMHSVNAARHRAGNVVSST